MGEALAAADLVLAPELMLTEVAKTLWRLQRAGQLATDGLQQRLSRATELVDVIEPDRYLQVEALALARREPAVLLTADQRLQQLAIQVLP
jgi:predicted nucleic acid-binding protein